MLLREARQFFEVVLHNGKGCHVSLLNALKGFNTLAGRSKKQTIGTFTLVFHSLLEAKGAMVCVCGCPCM